MYLYFCCGFDKISIEVKTRTRYKGGTINEKTVSIDRIVSLAITTRERAERYEREGRLELAKRETIRVEGMMSAISLGLDLKNFGEEWDKIYSLIYVQNDNITEL